MWQNIAAIVIGGIAAIVVSPIIWGNIIIPHLRLRYYAYRERVQIKLIRMHFLKWTTYAVFRRMGGTLSAKEFVQITNKMGLDLATFGETQFFLDQDPDEVHTLVCPFYHDEGESSLRYAARTPDGHYSEDTAPDLARWSSDTHFVAVFR